MTRQVLYVAAPLRPTAEEVVQTYAEGGCYRGEAPAAALHRNLGRAKGWLSWLSRSFPETTFIAPWIASIESGADYADPSQREAGLIDACAIIERCDGIVLCGGRVSDGMRREIEHGRTRGPGFPLGDAFEVFDLTPRLIAPPHPEAPAGARGRSFETWYAEVFGVRP